MNRIFLVFAIAAASLKVGTAAASTNCHINTPSTLTDPLNFDRQLWGGDDDFIQDRHFLVSQGLKNIAEISKSQAYDPAFLSSHNGEFAIAISKPYPGDTEPGDLGIALSTIDVSQPNQRMAWITVSGNLPQPKKIYGLMLTDITRHILISCH